MRRQTVKIKFPHLRIELGDKVLEVKGWEGWVRNLADLRYRINEGFHDTLRSLLLDLQKDALEATLTMEEFDKEITVPFVVDGIPWTIAPAISEQSLRVAAGEDIAIHFMGLLHKTLYDASTRSTNYVRGRVKTLATLKSLGLIGGYWQVTNKGRDVLRQLHELGPPSGRKGFVMTATEMLDVATLHKDLNPLRAYLNDRKLIVLHGKSLKYSGNYKLTHTGKEWLETNSVRMIQLKQFHQVALIKFLPLEALSQFLTSSEDFVRQEARRRATELEEGRTTI